jgi:hypothetical protein
LWCSKPPSSGWKCSSSLPARTKHIFFLVYKKWFKAKANKTPRKTNTINARMGERKIQLRWWRLLQKSWIKLRRRWVALISLFLFESLARN